MATIEERIGISGEITYRAKVRRKGAPSISRTFPRKTDAKIWAQRTEAEIRSGRYLKATLAYRITVAEMIDRYVETVLPLKPKLIYDQTQQLGWWKKELGSFFLANVTPDLIGRGRDKLISEPNSRGRKRTPATVNRYLAALSTAFSLAEKEWGYVDSNPVRKVRKLSESRGRVRYLSENERVRLLSACSQSDCPQLLPVVVIAIATGMRKNEILSLSWKDVDLDGGAALLMETKNGERRRVPLPAHAVRILREIHSSRPNSKFVFQSSQREAPADIRKAWEAALDLSGLSDFRFHDLRHTAASYLAMSGATTQEIAEVLGHKTLAMVKRYAHMSQSHVSRVVEHMNSAVFGS